MMQPKQGTLTDEFSIVLLCDEESNDLVWRARELLPPSPWRDDPPHLTLLRGFTSGLSDEELVSQLENLTDYAALIGERVTVVRPINLRGYFGWTCVLIVWPTRGLLRERRKLKDLMKGPFAMALLDRLVFVPHVTIRLGVYAGYRKRGEIRKIIPPGTPLRFKRVAIFRTLADGRKRFIHEVPLVGMG